jgi:hypothetical protein
MTMRRIGGITFLGLTLALFGCSDDGADTGGGGDGGTGTGGTSSGTGESGGSDGGDGGTDDGGTGDGTSGGSGDGGTDTSAGDGGGTTGTSSGGTTGGGTSDTGGDTSSTGATGGTTGGTSGTTGATGGTTGATGGTTGTTGGTGGTTSGGGCVDDQDCIADPAGAICNTATGDCVECLPTNDPCVIGTYCHPADLVCVAGCIDNADCPQPLTCDVPNNTCVGCIDNNDCGLGSLCDQGDCVPGCDVQNPCQPGYACCPDNLCYNLTNDLENCGQCDLACPPNPGNADPICDGGDCDIVCQGNWNNCNLDNGDGCETQTVCLCEPGEMRDCYYGPQGTEDVGICQGGEETCDDQGTGWGPCDGQVLPDPAGEICDNGEDDDCDGDTDEDVDDDGDGYTVCEGDCCDVAGPDCLNPELVNPGAFEVDGNDVDDDCDGTEDNPLPLCDDGGLASNSSDPLDYARAIDLCQFPNPADPADRRWGVLGGAFTRSNGAGSPNADSRSIRDGFGTNVTTWNNASTTIAIMSTGHAADMTDTSPNYAPFQSNEDENADAGVPADWLAANGNDLPNAPGCPDPQGGATGFDTIQLSFDIRVPTNANSFRVRMFFYSAEYPEWVCSPFNDFFVTLVDTGADNAPITDKNIAVYDDGVNLWPVGVNLVGAAPGLFTACQPDVDQPIGCGLSAVDGTYNGCVSTDELVGTGFDLLGVPPPQFGDEPGGCEAGDQVGGGTGWLTMSGNVTPGETATLRFVIWDTGDEYYDSVVLLDAWEWSVDASDPGVTPG